MNNSENIEKKLKKIFVETFNIKDKEININSSMKNIDKWDSLNHIGLINSIEQVFDLSFKDEEVINMTNFKKIIRSGYYISGSETKKFEKKFANYCNTKYCIAVGNCLDAIKLTLNSYIELGKIKKNDEVLVPANTYIATILAISAIGLKPVLIEPEIETYNINPNKINDAINKKTKAIIVVHLYGQPAKMKSILNITKKRRAKSLNVSRRKKTYSSRRRSI